MLKCKPFKEMQNKKIAMFSFLILPVISFANGVNDAATSLPVEKLMPTRQISARINTHKFEIAKDASGEFQFKSMPVCQKDVLLNVFDGRGKSSFMTESRDAIECEVESGKVKKVVVGGGSVVLRDQQLFDNEPASAVRANSFLQLPR